MFRIQINKKYGFFTENNSNEFISNEILIDLNNNKFISQLY